MRCAVQLLLFLVAAVVLLPASDSQSKVVFKVISIPGAKQTYAYSVSTINEVLAGTYIDQSGVQHGFERRNGQIVTLDDPNGTNTVCMSVNGAGGAVGYYTKSDGNSQAFSYTGDGNFEDIGPVDAVTSAAYGISGRGAIVGAYTTSVGGPSHGFYFDGRNYTILDAVGAVETWATGVSNNAYSLTWLDTTGHYQASFCRTNSCKSINVPGAVNTFAHSMDTYNDVAYSWQDAANNYHGALLRGHHYHKFDIPGGTSTQAYGVNGHYIIGQYIPTGHTTPLSFAGQACPPLSCQWSAVSVR